MILPNNCCKCPLGGNLTIPSIERLAETFEGNSFTFDPAIIQTGGVGTFDLQNEQLLINVFEMRVKLGGKHRAFNKMTSSVQFVDFIPVTGSGGSFQFRNNPILDLNTSSSYFAFNIGFGLFNEPFYVAIFDPVDQTTVLFENLINRGDTITVEVFRLVGTTIFGQNSYAARFMINDMILRESVNTVTNNGLANNFCNVAAILGSTTQTSIVDNWFVDFSYYDESELPV